MSFDLWSALGITPMAGLGIGCAGLFGAAVLAVRIFLRDRSREPRGVRLNDLPR